MTISYLLRQKWYPIFLPKPDVRVFKIYSWKAVGLCPYEGVIFNRMFDSKSKFLSIQEAEKSLLTEDDYIQYANSKGFSLNTKADHYLEFRESSST